MKTIYSLILMFVILQTTTIADWKPGDNLIDTRDGQSYKTVKIGNQVWMAENLNIGSLTKSTQGGGIMKNDGVIEKYCWNDSTGNCDGSDGKMKRGGFYEWEEAMQYWNGQPQLPVRGICPEGWHIPSNAEWNELINYLGGGIGAGAQMLLGGGSGFDALLTGYRCTMTGGFRVSAMASDTRTYFWTSEQTDAQNAPLLELGANSFTSFSFLKSLGLCVRCLWDGNSLSPKSEIKLTPEELNFNGVKKGESKDKVFSIENVGTAELEITDIQILNNTKEAYSLTDLTLPLIIPASGSEVLTVNFAPKDIGEFTSQLEITSNADNEPKKQLKLTGQGLSGKSVIEFSSDSINFGDNEINSEQSLSLMIINPGITDLTINNITLNNTDGNAFSLESVSLPFVVPPSDNKFIKFIFKPTKQKKYTAEAIIESDAENLPTKVIRIEGLGYDPNSIDAVNDGDFVNVEVKPNPFSGKAVIELSLGKPATSVVSIEIIEIAGTKIAEIFNGTLDSGYHEFELNSNNIPIGSYFVVVHIGNSKYRVKCLRQ